MRLFIFLCFIAILISPIESSGTIKIEFKTFSRPSGTVADGSCCDPNGCSCDPYFVFCWRGYLTPISSNTCSSGFITTGFYDERNTVNFGAMFSGNAISNPLTQSVNTEFTGRMQIYVEVWDYDIAFGNDFIDKFVVDFTVTSLNTLSTSRTFTGAQGSVMTIGKTLTCSNNYYGTLCSTFCVEHDNNVDGHYTCNPDDGSFVCLNGYTGSGCLTPICTTGCLNGGCTAPFTCNCESGWTGSTCSECIPRMNCDPSGGFCDGPFNCKCNPDYSGNNCQNDLAFCDHNPQVCNDGVCTTTGINASMCTCTDGYTGINCETGIDLCNPDPCVNGGCTNHMTDYDCVCDNGYEDKNCTEVIDNCPTSSCEYGICQNSVGSYTCDCSPGFMGTLCDAEINECHPDPCVTGDCIDFVNGYVCNCTDAGYVGRNCSLAAIDHPNPDYCSVDFNSCLNGATCDTDGAEPFFNCSCLDGYSGAYCGDNTDNCPSDPSSNPCDNDAVCIDLPGNDFRCRCQDGYEGSLCADDINECDLSPCNNDGVCSNFHGGFNCTCTVGFEGDTCIDRTDYCAMGNECANEATCVNNRFNYTCQCVVGFRGDLCLENIDDCMGVFCGNGSCVDGVNTFNCECLDGYIGLECDTELDECVTELSAVILEYPGSSSVCGVYGECFDLLAGFDCICNDRYTGDLCRDVITCADNPCNASNIVECLDGVTDTYECLCLPGFTGPQCEIDIDECAGFPCHNAAPCSDRRNDYFCDCIPPWKGKNCRYDNTSCLPNPCNSGECQDVDLDLGTYNCTCPTYTTGNNCELDLDECTTGDDLCPSDANCTNTIGSYFCECVNEGNGIDPLTCEVISASQGLSVEGYLYYVVIPVICFLVIALVIFIFLLFCCCCLIKRSNKKNTQSSEEDHYLSLDVANNYEEIANAQPHDQAVTNNPAYATAGIEFVKEANNPAVTSNPHYAGLQAEENVYQAEPNLSISISAQKIQKSAYNDINDLPVASDF
uniref:Delta-like protein n=1 Tax=Oopsacas minuta TaxID=111878 RepID=A0A2I4PHG8_9METZ|nr:Delta [Oopsacas minuta]